MATWTYIFDAADENFAGLPADVEKMLKYFAVEFKNSNQGTAGRHRHRVVSGSCGVRKNRGNGGNTATRRRSVPPPPEGNMVVAAQADTLPSPAPSSPATAVVAAHMCAAASDAATVSASSPSARFSAEKQTLASSGGGMMPTGSAFSWSFCGQLDGQQQLQAPLMYHQFQPAGRPGMFHSDMAQTPASSYGDADGPVFASPCAASSWASPFDRMH